MYLPKFLYQVNQALAPYQNFHLDLDFPTEDDPIICVGYSDLSKKEESWGNAPFEEGHTYIGFSRLKNLQCSMASIQWFDVSKHIAYMEGLNQLPVDLSCLQNIEVAITEAIWLIDVLGANDQISWPPGCNYEVLSAYYHCNNYDGASLLREYFGNNILWRDIAIAQLKFIIKTYLLSSPHYTGSANPSSPTTSCELDYLIGIMVNKFRESPPQNDWDTQSYTGLLNQELDDFL